MKKTPFIIVTLSALLAACSAGPDFQRPEAPATKAYLAEKEVLTQDQRAALGESLETEWWALFGSKPLNTLIIQAMQGNDGIAAARETLAQAEEEVRAESGGLLPQAGLSATAGRQKYGTALFGPSDFTIPPFTYYEAGPSASWTPDIFGGKKRAVERQQALAEYQAHELDAAYVSLTGNVAAQAIAMAAAKAEIAVVESIISEDRETLRLVKAALDAGGGTQLDVLSVQSQLDTDQALLPPLKQKLSVARHALSLLAGKAPGDWTPPDFDISGFRLPKKLPLSLPSELARKRPDILAAEANLHAASANVGVATANLYPKFTLSANTMQEALFPAGLFSGANNAWALAAGLTAPLFSGGTLTAEKRAAEHAYQASLAQYKETVLHAFGQVADALTALSHDAESVAAEQRAVDTAQAALDLARKSYEAGSTGLLQIQETQRQTAEARLGLIRAQSQRYTDTVRLFVALGGSPVKRQ